MVTSIVSTSVGRRRPALKATFSSLASLLILVLSSPSAVQAAAGDVEAGGYSSSNTACTRYYEVGPGDTCDKIGQMTFTSTYQIMAFNLPKAGPDCYTLEIGAQLCLGRYGNDCQLVHRAVEPETCDSIAAMYGIAISTLQTNNPSLDCQRVYDGLVLCVAPGVVRPPPPADLNATAIAEAGQQHAAQEKTQQQQIFVQAPQKVQKQSTPIGGVSAQSTPDTGHRHYSDHRHHHHNHATQEEARSSSKHSTRSPHTSSKHSNSSSRSHPSSTKKPRSSTKTDSSSHHSHTSSATTNAAGKHSSSSAASPTAETAEIVGDHRPASSTSTQAKKGATATAHSLSNTESTSTSSQAHKSSSDDDSKGHSTSTAETSKASSPLQQIVGGVLDKLL